MASLFQEIRHDFQKHMNHIRNGNMIALLGMLRGGGYCMMACVRYTSRNGEIIEVVLSQRLREQIDTLPNLREPHKSISYEWSSSWMTSFTFEFNF
jgi:hypothetical protein